MKALSKINHTYPSISLSIFFFLSSIISGVSKPAGIEVMPDGVISPSAGVTKPDLSGSPSTSPSPSLSSSLSSSLSDSNSPHAVLSISSSISCC